MWERNGSCASCSALFPAPTFPGPATHTAVLAWRFIPLPPRPGVTVWCEDYNTRTLWLCEGVDVSAASQEQRAYLQVLVLRRLPCHTWVNTADGWMANGTSAIRDATYVHCPSAL
jgi:hypothetical protein